MESITRRSFLKTSLISSYAIASSITHANERTPNVLFIILDDLNTWLGFMNGHPQTCTPNLDIFSEQSTVFENAFCQFPLCIPSRASFLTGLTPFSTGIIKDENIWSKNIITFPQFFKEKGYFTIGLGKIFHNETDSSNVWDIYIKPEYPELNYKVNRGRIGFSDNFDWGFIDLDEKDFGDYKLVNKFEDIVKNKTKWCATIGLRLPHTPLFIPKKYKDQFNPNDILLSSRYENDLADVPTVGKKLTDFGSDQNFYTKIKELGVEKEITASYLASIHFADQIIGNLLRSLEKNLLLDNTIVIITSDNGWHLGEKMHWRKYTLWKESVHIPLLLYLPKIKPKRIKSAVGLIDIFPTLTHACNLFSTPHTFEGSNLLPLLEDKTHDFNEKTIISQIGFKNIALRNSSWTYIMYEDGSEELYDREKDPQETKNIANIPQLTQTKELLFTNINERVKNKMYEYLHDSLKEKFKHLVQI